jgi:hypothetical protein
MNLLRRPLADVVKEASTLVVDPEQRYKDILNRLQVIDKTHWHDGLLVPEHMLSFLLYSSQLLEERATQEMWKKFAEEETEISERELLKCWERAALYRRYATEIMAYGIHPRHLFWDGQGKLVILSSPA